MIKAVSFIIVFIGLACSVSWANPCTREDEKNMESYCGDVKEGDASGAIRCLEKNIDKLSPACAEDMRKNIENLDRQTDHCRAAVKEYCGYKLNIKKPPGRKKAEKLSECLMMNWDQLGEECRQYVRMSIPFFVLMEPGLEERAREMREKKSRERKVRINGKKVTVVKEEGDDVWYRAQIVDRKVVDAYELCPEVDLEGLKSEVSIGGVCYYDVKARWTKDIVEELREAGLLDFINNHGLYDGGILRDEEQILGIVEQYSHNCPEGFNVDVINYFNGTQQVICGEKESRDCKQEYVHTKKKFFGCQKFAECNEMDPKYVAYGDPERCGYCQAGGCLDHGMKGVSRGIDLLYCRVNRKDPKTYPYCEGKKKTSVYHGAYRGVTNVLFENGLPKESIFRMGREELYKTEYNEHGMPSVKKDMVGNIMGEWEYDRDGEFIKFKVNEDYVPPPAPPPPEPSKPAKVKKERKPHPFWDG